MTARRLHMINGVAAMAASFTAITMMTIYGDVEPPNAWALATWLIIAFAGLPALLFLAVRHLWKGLEI